MDATLSCRTRRAQGHTCVQSPPATQHTLTQKTQSGEWDLAEGNATKIYLSPLWVLTSSVVSSMNFFFFFTCGWRMENVMWECKIFLNAWFHITGRCSKHCRNEPHSAPENKRLTCKYVPSLHHPGHTHTHTHSCSQTSPSVVIYL